MVTNYVVIAADANSITVKRYLIHPGIPQVDDIIFHNTVPLAEVQNLVYNETGWVIASDRSLPYILIGTILSIGIP